MARYKFTIEWATRAGTDEFGLPIVETGSYEVEEENNNRAAAIRRVKEEARGRHGKPYHWGRTESIPDQKDWHAVTTIQRIDKTQDPEYLNSKSWKLEPTEEDEEAIGRIKNAILAKLPGEAVKVLHRIWVPVNRYETLYAISDQAALFDSHIKPEQALAVAEAIRVTYTTLTDIEIKALFVYRLTEGGFNTLRAAATWLQFEKDVKAGPKRP